MRPAYKQHVREFVKGGRAALVNHSLDEGLRLKDARNRPSGNPNCGLFPQGTIIPVPPSTPLYRPVGIDGNNLVVFPGRVAKKALVPEGSEAVVPVISLAALLYGDAETAPGATRRHQNANSEASPAIPTLSRSLVVAPFQLGLVWLSVLPTLPPNPSACPRVGVWDKPRDKFANYFETASPQFHFCPRDKNGLVLRP